MPSSPGPRLAPAHSGWQRILATGIGSLPELAAELDLPIEALGGDTAASAKFPLRVPRGFVRRMRRRDPHDPLLLQILPGARELTDRAGFVADPLGELAQMQHPGLLKKYLGRALLIATGACAVHCRYCFRREFPYAEASASSAEMAHILEAIAADKSIREVILSGGDPLSLSDARLQALLEPLAKMAHVERIRIHTRLPIVLPERVDSGLLTVLRRASPPVIIVLHSNHAREIDETVASAVARLRSVCAAILNQSVLLRGVNDDSACLVALSERLFQIGVMPYYLHQLDPVRGAAHFRVGERRAQVLMGEVAAQLPGYLVPRLVRERQGFPAKELLVPILHNRRGVT